MNTLREKICLTHILEWEQYILYYEPTFKWTRLIELSFILQIDIEETTHHLNMSHLKIYFILFIFGKGELF